MTYPSDEAVMAAVQSGHTALLSVLFERYQEKAFGLCYHLVRDRSLADDLVQDAFLRVLRYRASYRVGASFAPWFFRIVRNICFDRMQSDQREAASLNRIESVEHEAAPRLLEETDERIELVRRAMKRLSPEQRAVLVLRRVDELSYAEIAERLGTNAGQERVRAHRALRQLRSIIQTIEATANEM